MQVKVNNLSFGFSPEIKVLNNITFEVNSGETVAIIGQSGCGKSTLLRLLAGIITKNENYLSGEISLEKTSIRKQFSPLSFMFQESVLMPFLTVAENIKLPLRIKGIECEHMHFNTVVESVGLTDHTDLLPKQLSGGMKSRVALARSFITSPDLLLLDEPFSSLDVAWRHCLYQELDQLKDQTEATVIMVTHDLDEAVRLADKILVLKPGGQIDREFVVSEHKPIKLREGLYQLIIANHG